MKAPLQVYLQCMMFIFLLIPPHRTNNENIFEEKSTESHSQNDMFLMLCHSSKSLVRFAIKLLGKSSLLIFRAEFSSILRRMPRNEFPSSIIKIVLSCENGKRECLPGFFYCSTNHQRASHSAGDEKIRFFHFTNFPISFCG